MNIIIAIQVFLGANTAPIKPSGAHCSKNPREKNTALEWAFVVPNE